MKHLSTVVVLVLIGCCTGCNATSREPVASSRGTGNSLAGKIVINKSHTMPEGAVYLYNDASGRPVAGGRIQADGTYRINNAPLGPVQLVVTRDGSMRPPVTPGMHMQNGPGRQPFVGPKGPPRRPVNLGVPPEPGAAEKSAPEPPSPDARVSLTPEMQKLLDMVDRQYGSLAAPGKLTFTISTGENEFNIDLEVSK